jgi:hypothetical protein
MTIGRNNLAQLTPSEHECILASLMHLVRSQRMLSTLAPPRKTELLSSRRTTLDHPHISPTNSIRNFDLSYISSRLPARWPDNSLLSNDELKKAFEGLVKQAKMTELRMEEVLKEKQKKEDREGPSTDENVVDVCEIGRGIGRYSHYYFST